MNGNAEECNHPVARGRAIFVSRKSDTNCGLFELFLGMIQVLFDELDEF